MKKHGSLYIPGQEKSQFQRAVGKITDEVNAKRAKILDDFAKAYMADTGLQPHEIALVQENKPTEIRFRFMHSPLVKGTELESKLLVCTREYVEAKQKFKDTQKEFSESVIQTDEKKDAYLQSKALYEAAHGRLLFILNKIEQEKK